MIRQAITYLVLLPAFALWAFHRIVPAPNMMYGRDRSGEPPALAEATRRLLASYDTVRALDVAHASVRARNLARRAVSRAPAPAWEPRLDRSVALDGVVLHAEALVSPPMRTAILATIAAELRAIGHPTPAAPISVIAVLDSGLLYPRYRRAVVLPERDDAPCTVVMFLSFRFTTFAGDQGSDRLLGTCAFFASFGPPGGGMRQWLASTRLRNAAYLQLPASHGRGGVLGQRDMNLLGSNLSVMSCRAGRADACDGLFDAGRALVLAEGRRIGDLELVPRPEDVLLSTPNTFGYPSTIVTNGLLAGLAHDLGAARFAEVWRSPLPLRRAIERAAGRPVSAWVHDFLRQRMPEYRTGPTLTPVQWAMAFAAFGAFTALAVGRTKRRLS